MGRVSDQQIEDARAMTIAEVMERVPLPELKSAGRELVGPCPSCGGDDRFSINKDRNVYNCRSCGGGDAIGLAALALGCDFLDAVAHLAGASVEIDEAERLRRQERRRREREKRDRDAERYRQKAISDARAIWRGAASPIASPVEDYLALRGIRFSRAAWPHSIRFRADHPYVLKVGRQLRTLHRGPCMICAILGPDGTGRAVHQTWIDLSREDGKAIVLHPETGEPVNSKMVRGSKKGGAIPLGGPDGTGVLVMGEGVETTLTARLARPELGAFWAGVDLGNMSGPMVPAPRGALPSGLPDLSDDRAFRVPDWVTRLVLVQDGDSEPVKTRAHLDAAVARARHQNPALIASIVHPGTGLDLNDLLRSE